MVKDPINVIRGTKNRASGAEFERRVRKDLEDKGWIVDKWSNQVELLNLEHEIKHKDIIVGPIIGKIVPAKHKWNGPNRPMMMGAGFPDFLAFKKAFKLIGEQTDKVYEVIGVESKVNGYLDKKEREKCKWLLDNNIFSKILIASKHKVKNKIVVEYDDFEEKYESSNVHNAKRGEE